MSKTSNVPQIRFKGFTDAWEQRKLGEVIRLNGRIGFRGYTEKDIVSKNDGGVLTFSPTNIVDNKLTTNCKNTYITRFKYDESPEIKIHNGDILFVKTGSTLGKSALVTELSEDATLNPQVVVMRSNNLNVEFLAAMLVTNSITSQVNSSKIGGAVPTLTETRIKDFDVAIPVSETEGKQIGHFFRQLDGLITLHQRKYNQVVNLKKAMLEKMFPKDGKDIPDNRFKGFTDAWGHWELSEVADRFDNLRIPISAADRIPGKTPYYGANGIQDYVDGYTHDGEFLLVAEDGANDLEDYPVNYVKGKIWVNNHAHVIQSKPDIAINSFLMYAIKQLKMSQFIVGGGRAKLNAEVMMSLPITMPDTKEQLLIGDYFQKIDNLITLHQRKLQQLKHIKKAMLEKMFV